jgi:hypothetical protein
MPSTAPPPPLLTTRTPHTPHTHHLFFLDQAPVASEDIPAPLLLEASEDAVAAFLEAVGAPTNSSSPLSVARSLASAARLVPRSGLKDIEERRRCMLLAGLLPWALASLARHDRDSDVAAWACFLARRVSWACLDSDHALWTDLRAALPTVHRALDSHQGSALVVEHVLALLVNLAADGIADVEDLQVGKARGSLVSS